MPSITIPIGNPETIDILRNAPIERNEPGSGEVLADLVGRLGGGTLFDPSELGPDALTPEMILVMLQKRLSALDSQIQVETATIQDAAKESEGISEMIQAVGALRDAMAAEESKSDEKVDLDDITVTVGETTYTGTELVNELGLHEELGLNDKNKTSREVVKGFIERLQLKQRSINSGNEMAMVRLQSAIGKRQQGIQLTTNVLNNFHQSGLAVIGNIK